LHASLQIDDFYIGAGDVKYLADVEAVTVGGWPGNEEEQTLELE
jgi:hypothetical protein